MTAALRRRHNMTPPVMVTPLHPADVVGPAYTRIRRKTPVASGSGASSSALRNATPSSSAQTITNEERHFQRLQDGEGIAAWEWEGLVEQCVTCQLFFGRRALENHLPSCTDIVDLD